MRRHRHQPPPSLDRARRDELRRVCACIEDGRRVELAAVPALVAALGDTQRMAAPLNARAGRAAFDLAAPGRHSICRAGLVLRVGFAVDPGPVPGWCEVLTRPGLPCAVAPRHLSAPVPSLETAPAGVQFETGARSSWRAAA